jgi:S-DNA-T family DNA segregation ATPase FtsK/SpoIIIE
LLIAGLDRRSRVYAIDLKGTGDLTPTALFAHSYSSSVGADDDQITDQLQAMRDLRAELRRRAKVIRGLPRELCLENEVTWQLANERSLGLEPVVVGVDECQKWFQHEDKAIREEIAICTDLVTGAALRRSCANSPPRSRTATRSPR